MGEEMKELLRAMEAVVQGSSQMEAASGWIREYMRAPATVHIMVDVLGHYALTWEVRRPTYCDPCHRTTSPPLPSPPRAVAWLFSCACACVCML